MANAAANIAALCHALLDIPVSVVSDVLAEAGFPDQIVSSALRRLSPMRRIAGPARCFTGRSGIGEPDGRDLVYEADRVIMPGDIVVLDTGQFHTAAVIGGNTLAGWNQRGCAGVILDGLLRDCDDLAKTPCFGRGVTPLNSKGRWHYTCLDKPCFLPGQSTPRIPVAPGDIVHADSDGIAIIPQDVVGEIVRFALKTHEVERAMMMAIERGVDRGHVYKTHPRFEHIRKLVP